MMHTGTEAGAVPSVSGGNTDPPSAAPAFCASDMDCDSVAETGPEEHDLEDLLSAVYFQQANRVKLPTSDHIAGRTTRVQSVRIVLVAVNSGIKKPNPLKQLMSLLEAGQARDPSFKIARWRSAGSEQPLDSPKSLALAQRTIRVYLHTRQNAIVNLSGEINIHTSRDVPGVMTDLVAWGKMRDYTFFIAPCQAEDKDNIGMLVNGTKSVNILQLTAAIKQHTLWASAGGFKFGLTMAFFHWSQG